MSILNTVARAVEGFVEGASHPYTSAVILAGGMGSRMGALPLDTFSRGRGATTKQFCRLGEEPVILRTVRAFEACDVIDEIILVVRGEESDIYAPMLREAGICKVTKITVGGETRQDSAFAGLQAVSDKCAFIAIHDGARPLIRPEEIRAVAREAYHIGAAAAASRAKDTVKLLDKKGYVESTPARDGVWLAATPQIFKVEEYRAAVYMGEKEKRTVTDDCSLVEALGFPVKLVDIGWQNLKITTPEDLYFAEAVLAMRRDAEERKRRAEMARMEADHAVL